MQSIKTGQWAEASIHGHAPWRRWSSSNFPGCDWSISDGTAIWRTFWSLDHWGGNCCFTRMTQSIMPIRPHPMPQLSKSWSHVIYACICVSVRDGKVSSTYPATCLEQLPPWPALVHAKNWSRSGSPLSSAPVVPYTSFNILSNCLKRMGTNMRLYHKFLKFNHVKMYPHS